MKENWGEALKLGLILLVSGPPSLVIPVALLLDVLNWIAGVPMPTWVSDAVFWSFVPMMVSLAVGIPFVIVVSIIDLLQRLTRYLRFRYLLWRVKRSLHRKA